MKRILVVDDNPDILEILQIGFEAKGFNVLTLADGEQVSESIQRFSPDIILLDVYLGRSNGLTICSELKSKPETKHIPIVMFSAHVTGDAILKICGADGFVAKPFNINHLTQVIELQLERAV